MKTIKGEITTSNSDVLHPITDLDCVFDSEGKPLDIIVDEIKQYPIIETINLLAANWSTSTPSTYTVTDTRYTSKDSVWELIFPNLTDVQEEALTNADIKLDGTHDGYFVITARGEKPTMDLPAKIKIERL